MSKSEYLKESFPRFYKKSRSKHNAAKPNPRKTCCYQQGKWEKEEKRVPTRQNGNEMEIKKPGFYKLKNTQYDIITILGNVSYNHHISTTA
jgi:hypothetical protein